jgi:hypothetical protein
LTLTFQAANGGGAGPALTEPSAAQNLPPWHGQLRGCRFRFLTNSVRYRSHGTATEHDA